MNPYRPNKKRLGFMGALLAFLGTSVNVKTAGSLRGITPALATGSVNTSHRNVKKNIRASLKRRNRKNYRMRVRG